ncbi:MAG TPA: UDP-glucose/GDP-mannose dehydrogenase family protein, partial [Gemmatimonadales bacterium]|nr:UDP-glucose/GDP-mannose dehydrogenase family protein [Gemmatimonadales bacterium]
VVEESPAIALIRVLLGAGVAVIGHDPLAMDEVRAEFGDLITYASSPAECLEGSRCWVIATPWAQFRDHVEQAPSRDGALIVDCWRVLDGTAFPRTASYVPMGSGPGMPVSGRRGLVTAESVNRFETADAGN